MSFTWVARTTDDVGVRGLERTTTNAGRRRIARAERCLALTAAAAVLTLGLASCADKAKDAAQSSASASRRAEVELRLGDKLLGRAAPTRKGVSLHWIDNLPQGSKTAKVLLDATFQPPEGAALELHEGDTFELRVTPGTFEVPLADEEGVGVRQDQGAFASFGNRFDVSIDGTHAATVGSPVDGGISVDAYLVIRDEKASIALHATAEDVTHFWHWAFPNLRPGNVVVITVLGPGTVDRPTASEPRKAPIDAGAR